MFLLVSTVIGGQERKKKLQVPETATSLAELRPLVTEVFSGEKGLGDLQRLDIFDEDFGEYVDFDGSATVKDKTKLKAVFKSGMAPSATPSVSETEKDRIIEQLRQRLVHLEGNMRILSSKASAADRSETHSQKSATSDLRRRKCEEKQIPADASPDDPLRQAKREEKKLQKKQEAAAEMIC